MHVDVRDVDHLPISHHQIGIEFSWSGAKFAHVWGGKGSSNYVATLPPSLIADGGRYELIVTALDGFKQGVGHVPECVLLRTLIYVESDNTQFYIAAGLVVLLVLCIALLGFVLARKREQSKHLLLSFLSFEGILVRDLAPLPLLHPCAESVPFAASRSHLRIVGYYRRWYTPEHCMP